MIKKIILGLFVVIIVAVVGLFTINGKDNYDPTKYSAVATNGINIGSKIEFTLPDQFDKPHSLTNKTKKLIVVFAKSTGHTVKDYLNKQDRNYLIERDTLFVADISPMPTVIRNTFALPDLRKSPYSVILIYDENISKSLKNKEAEDKIAIVKLKDKKVIDVKYITTTNELKNQLQ
jgi:hypothetical protein